MLKRHNHARDGGGRRRWLATTGLTLVSLTAAACPRTGEAPAAGPEVVESSALGLRLLDPEPPWTLTTREADRWVLSDGAGGTMTVHMGPAEDQTPNIVEAVRTRLAEFEAMGGGESFGGQQFQAPVGLVYTARGRYSHPDNPVEAVGEITGYTVHPAGGRFVLLTYTYPGDADPAVRYDRLLSLLGSLEPLPQESAVQ